MESHKRSVVKSVSYRIVASAATGLLSYLVLNHFDYSKSAEAASLIGGIDVFVKLATFYVHERVWDKISFGRHKESQLENISQISQTASTKSLSKEEYQQRAALGAYYP
jgi:uncharacterized membrane protein